MAHPLNVDHIRLTGRQKSAILLVTLGVEASSPIFKGMEEEEVEYITKEIINLKEVTPQQRAMVMDEFYQIPFRCFQPGDFFLMKEKKELF